MARYARGSSHVPGTHSKWRSHPSFVLKKEKEKDGEAKKHRDLFHQENKTQWCAETLARRKKRETRERRAFDVVVVASDFLCSGFAGTDL